MFLSRVNKGRRTRGKTGAGTCSIQVPYARLRNELNKTEYLCVQIEAHVKVA